MRISSTSLELRKIIGQRLFNFLNSKIPDRRDLFIAAAANLRISELELFKELSERTGLPVLKKLPNNFKILLSSNFSIDQYEKRAFGFLKALNSPFSLACVDPAWVPEDVLALKPTCLLTPWSNLKEWITTATKSVEDESCSDLIDSKQIVHLLPEHAIDSLIKRVASLGSSSVALEFSSKSLQYEVIAPDLKTYSGEIETTVSKEIKNILLASNKKSERKIDGTEITIFVSESAKSSRLYISWTPDLLVTKGVYKRLFGISNDQHLKQQISHPSFCL